MEALAAAQSLYVEEQFEEAVASYSAYLSTSPDVAGYSGRAACYLQLKKYLPALQDLNNAITMGSTKHIDYYRKAVALFELEEYEAAKKTFVKAKQMKLLESSGADLSAHDRYIRKCDAEINGKVSPYSSPPVALICCIRHE